MRVRGPTQASLRALRSRPCCAVIAKLAAAVREAAQRGGEGEEGAANEERVRSALM